jgi:site-specific DNA recombinase
LRIAIYVRVSTQRQAQTQTIEQQIERLQAHIRDRGWVLEAEQIYQDNGYSGSKLNRPGLDALRDHAALADFDLVLITAPDRLARNYVHQVLIIEDLAKRGVAVEFLDRPMSDDPHDQLLLQIRGAVAEYERTLIADRMRRGRLSKYRAGKLIPWIQPPYGYRVDPDHPRDPALLQLDSADSAVVLQLFEEYLEPRSTLYSIAKRLSDLGIPTPTGKPRWNVSSIRGILTNTAYVGRAVTNRRYSVPAKHRKSAMLPAGPGVGRAWRPEEDWIVVPVPAIVSQEIFNQVQAKLSTNQKTSPRNNKAYQYLLRGLVSCGVCRLSATGRAQSPGYYYYMCRGRHDALRAAQGQRCTARYIPARQLDELVWQDLCAVLVDPEIVRHALERAHGGHWLPQELQSRLAALTHATQELDRYQERLLEGYLAQVIELPEFERKRKEIAQKRDALQKQSIQLQATATQRIALSQVADSIETFCAKIRPVLEQATFDQKRQLVELLVDHVVVTNGDVEIHYVIPTQPEGPHIPFSHLCLDYRNGFRRSQRGGGFGSL